MEQRYKGIYADYSFAVYTEQTDESNEHYYSDLDLNEAQQLFKEKLSVNNGYVSLEVKFFTPGNTANFELVYRDDTNRIHFIDDKPDKLEEIHEKHGNIAAESMVWKNDLDLLHYNKQEFENASWQRFYAAPENRTIVVDTETTGFNAGRDELLQVSIINGEGETLYNSYIKPTHTTEWSDAQAINGISPEMVADAPTIDQEIGKINRILTGAKTYVGYNSNFDINFLRVAGAIFTEKMKIVDVMKDFAPIYGEWDDYHGSYKWQKLTKCADYYGYDWANDKAHDSLSDCRATLFCYNKIECHKNLTAITEKVKCDPKHLFSLEEKYQQVLSNMIATSSSDNYAISTIVKGLIKNDADVKERLDLYLDGKPFPDNDYYKGVQNYRILCEDNGFVLAVSPLQYAHWRKNQYGRGVENGIYNFKTVSDAMSSYVKRVGTDNFAANEMQRFADGTHDDRLYPLYELANDRFEVALTFQTKSERESGNIVRSYGKNCCLPMYDSIESKDYDNMLSYFIIQQGHDISEIHEAVMKNPKGFPPGQIFADSVRFVGTVADEITNNLSEAPALTLLVNLSGMELVSIIRHRDYDALAPLVFDSSTKVCLYSEQEGKGGPIGIVPDKEIWIPLEYLSGVRVINADTPENAHNIKKDYCLSRAAFEHSFKYIYGNESGRSTVSYGKITMLDDIHRAVKNVDADELAKKADTIVKSETQTIVTNGGRKGK